MLVDIGTGFYVEKVRLCRLWRYNVGKEGHRLIRGFPQTPPAAREFYSRKVEELGRNLLDLEKIVQGKQGNLNVVEDGECSVVESAWQARRPGGGRFLKWFRNTNSTGILFLAN